MTNLRALLVRHQPVVIGVALVGLLAAFLTIAWFVGGAMREPAGPPLEAQAYFYDLNTGELFSASASESGPIDTDSGPHQGQPAGVRAIVLSCTSCNDPNARFVAWLELPKETEDEDGEPDLLIRSPDGDKWHLMDSQQGEAIMDAATGKCTQGQRIRFCHPPIQPAR